MRCNFKIDGKNVNEFMNDFLQESVSNYVRNCNKCYNCLSRYIALGNGDKNPEIMCIGELPNTSKETITSLKLKNGHYNVCNAFTGKAGDFLRDIVKEAGFKSAYYTNLLKHGFEDNKVNEERWDNCSNWLDTEIAIVNPKIIILLGTLPTKYILELDNPNKVRNTMIEVGRLKYFSTWHPSYCSIYNRISKNDYLNIFKKIKKEIEVD
jgi:DNA polymerase